MSTVIEARRLNGTDLGKTIDNYGVIHSVKHAEESFKSRLIGYADETVVETKVVEIRTSRGQFILHPTAKITITGRPNPEAVPVPKCARCNDTQVVMKADCAGFASCPGCTALEGEN